MMAGIMLCVLSILFGYGLKVARSHAQQLCDQQSAAIAEERALLQKQLEDVQAQLASMPVGGIDTLPLLDPERLVQRL